MRLNTVIPAVRGYLELWFHKRNIIIVSKKKVKHIPLSGKVQFFGLLFIASGICWVSYSTGSFMAARSALKEQTQAIRAIANNRLEGSLPAGALPHTDLANADTKAGDPAYTVASEDSTKIAEHLAFLEKRVTELQEANKSIIARVRDKTGGHIDELESIIKQTGLKSQDLKREYSQSNPEPKHKHNGTPAEGGPFIPVDTAPASPEEAALFSDLDKLEALRSIVGTIPLAYPVAESNEESGFGRRTDPFSGRMAFHSGLDLAGPIGSKIMSTGDGKVVIAGRLGAYGNCVDISHGLGISTRYGHLSQILVHPGQMVKKGDVIGIQGSTGRSTGPHVHYEVRYHEQPLNPKRFLEVGQDVSEE